MSAALVDGPDHAVAKGEREDDGVAHQGRQVVGQLPHDKVARRHEEADSPEPERVAPPVMGVKESLYHEEGKQWGDESRDEVQPVRDRVWAEDDVGVIEHHNG